MIEQHNRYDDRCSHYEPPRSRLHAWWRRRYWPDAACPTCPGQPVQAMRNDHDRTSYELVVTRCELDGHALRRFGPTLPGSLVAFEECTRCHAVILTPAR